MLDNDLDGTACKMRFYFKEPTYEMLPFDEYNQVPLIYKIKPDASLLLAHPYPRVVGVFLTAHSSIQLVRRRGGSDCAGGALLPILSVRLPRGHVNLPTRACNS